MDGTDEKPKGRWCLVGNIVEERRYGEHGEVRRGTRLFAPGAKVYCLPSIYAKHGGGDRLFAIGRHRKSGRFIGTVLRPELLVEPRAKVVYHPEVLRRIDEELAGAGRGFDDPWIDREAVESYIDRCLDEGLILEPRRPTRPLLVLPDPTPVFRLLAVVYDALVDEGVVAADAPFELLNGALAWMPPRPPLAAACVERVRRALETAVPEGFHVRAEKSIQLSAYDQPRPALAVVRGRRDLYDRVHPSARVVGLVVEVALPGLDRTRGADGELFAKARIPRYWIVDPVARGVEVLRDCWHGAYDERTTFRDGAKVPLELDALDRGSIAVADLLP